ncbi:bifunctional 3-deoxy-7-phosphoheptulonate synthase/chorismate mutase [Desulfosporosinus sp.]|uniref:bifunctional 3-deoxy-7-phosphoheptulonate synthase/chorismate mutase n=1 Tax=Desulfosporosinus sp. TaxID=157907 RepID=UPI000E8BCA12|nr:bifunctional 3-deoxy-7-phosphoheptulonate synthase/chorismate mutase [Desulfosporosinus sp.]MBC2724714.1 bifunctional 3-deoxy-7-phosphoheptulonate synthase/chorismate mutase [Desulfosporosinus sp.]MBC2726602.1 bifunctional 3-deoxy-7-phosphoheptulonate synthase/chorismate mutase [Desulfosporosinus sp.]HBV87633.1 3-deoxy-7-phosphoheptulonate synthase [Desulfosporosinus sp.]
MKDLKLAGLKAERSSIEINGVTLGGKEIILMGGPCAVESSIQMSQSAITVKKAGGKILRGGVFKPRTSPYSFQGLGLEGLNYLVQAAREQDLLCVTEVIDAPSLELVIDKVDIIQIGARNMQNFELLKLAGKIQKPVILKRGLSATIEEWLLAAEYILAAGNPQVILCERGIRTYEPSTRNTLDLSAVGVAKELSHLPVIVDPSHAAGRRDLIASLSKAAIAMGADGLLIETHPNPAEAVSDGPQSLTPEQFIQLAGELGVVAQSVNRVFAKSLKSGQDTLESLRTQIDSIDQAIIESLAARMEIVRKVGDQKRLDRVKDTNREKEILQRLVNQAMELQLPTDLVKKIYPLIFESAVQSQIKDKLAKDKDLERVSEL